MKILYIDVFLKAEMMTAHALAHVNCRQGVTNGRPHIWNSRGHIVCLLSMATTRGRLYSRCKFHTRAFLTENFCSILGPIFDFGEIFLGLNLNFEFLFSKRFDSCLRPRCLSHRA